MFTKINTWLKNYWHWILIIAIAFLLIDIIGRFAICFKLPFKPELTQNLNNILTPIISILGFGGIVFTVILMNRQNKETRSLDLYNYYQNKVTQFFTSKNKQINIKLDYGIENINESIPIFHSHNILIPHLIWMDNFQKIKESNKSFDAYYNLKYTDIKNIIKDQYIQFFLNNNEDFIRLINEIENNYNLTSHYRKTLIYFILSEYLVSYSRICYYTLLIPIYQDLIGEEKIKKFYSLYHYFFFSKNLENNYLITSLCVD